MAAYFLDKLNLVRGNNVMEVRRPQTVSELEKWIVQGARGTWCLYWQGFLPLDKREERKDVERGAQRADYNAHVVSSIAFHACQAGLVDLFQRRVNDGEYRYWARKR